MKNITFSADERVIAAAREQARRERRTLNEAFREWLTRYGAEPGRAERAQSVWERISTYAYHDGRKFTRDEMNER